MSGVERKEPTAREWHLSRELGKALVDLHGMFSDQEIHIIKNTLLQVLIANREDAR